MTEIIVVKREYYEGWLEEKMKFCPKIKDFQETDIANRINTDSSKAPEDQYVDINTFYNVLHKDDHVFISSNDPLLKNAGLVVFGYSKNTK